MKLSHRSSYSVKFFYCKYYNLKSFYHGKTLTQVFTGKDSATRKLLLRRLNLERSILRFSMRKFIFREDWFLRRFILRRCHTGRFRHRLKRLLSWIVEDSSWGDSKQRYRENTLRQDRTWRLEGHLPKFTSTSVQYLLNPALMLNVLFLLALVWPIDVPSAKYTTPSPYRVLMQYANTKIVHISMNTRWLITNNCLLGYWHNYCSLS